MDCAAEGHDFERIIDAAHTHAHSNTAQGTGLRATHDSSLTSTTKLNPSEDTTSFAGEGTGAGARLVIMVSQVRAGGWFSACAWWRGEGERVHRGAGLYTSCPSFAPRPGASARCAWCGRECRVLVGWDVLEISRRSLPAELGAWAPARPALPCWLLCGHRMRCPGASAGKECVRRQQRRAAPFTGIHHDAIH